jgi:hypothetical protein
MVPPSAGRPCSPLHILARLQLGILWRECRVEIAEMDDLAEPDLFSKIVRLVEWKRCLVRRISCWTLQCLKRFRFGPSLLVQVLLLIVGKQYSGLVKNNIIDECTNPQLRQSETTKPPRCVEL